MKNYYEILELNPKASPEIIEKAYHVLAKRYHPDTQADDAEKMRCEQMLKDINEAYYVLSDVFLREQYDKEIQRELANSRMNVNSVEDGAHLNSDNRVETSIFDKSRNLFRNRRMEEQDLKNQKQESEIKYDEQSEVPYKVGTFSAILAIVQKLLRFKPDFSRIKNIGKRDVIIFAIAILVVVILCVILWFIPFTNSFIRHLLFMK